MASELIDFQDSYPAHLASKDITRQIRVKAQSARRLSDDPLKSLLLLKDSTNPPFKYCIHQVGLYPFYVHIWTPKQLKMYNLHSSKTYSRLFLDATGGVVQKLQKSLRTRSGHIFLYLEVVQISEPGEGLTPVVQMLSKRYNAVAIAYWFSDWLSASASILSESILDDSAALILATSRVFGQKAFNGHLHEQEFLTPSE